MRRHHLLLIVIAATCAACALGSAPARAVPWPPGEGPRLDAPPFLDALPHHAAPACLDAPPRQAALPREDANISLLAHLAEGPSAAVAVTGDLVLLGHGGYVELLDFADPAEPALLGRHRLHGFVTAIEVEGGLAAAYTEERGIHLLDVADPHDVRELAFLPVEEYLGGIAIRGTLLYVGLSDSFRIFDIADPAAPAQLGVLEQPNLGVFDLWGDFAYVGKSPGYLLVIDCSDPAAPRVENTLPPAPGMPQYVAIACDAGRLNAVMRDYAGFHSVRILDLADPAQPVLLGALTGDLDLHGLAVAGTRLTGIATDSLRVYDAADPAKILLVGAAPLLDEPADVKVRVDLAFVAEPDFGLQCLGEDGGLPRRDIVELSRYGEGLHGACTDVALAGDLLVAAATAPALATYDVSDPLHPVPLGSIHDHVPGKPDMRAFEISLKGDLAFLRCNDTKNSWLRVVDISDPAEPVERAVLPGALANIQFRGDVGYSIHNFGVNELHVDDFADPDAPAHVATYSLPDWSAHLVAGDRLLVATGSDLVVYDIADPERLVELGQADLAWGSACNFITATGDSGLATFAAYLVSGGAGAMRIVDYSDPGAIVVHAGPAPGSSPYGIIRDGDYLYLATGPGGVEAYAADDPLAPALAGRYLTGYYNWNVAGRGRLLCAADSHAGIFLLRNDLVLSAAEDAPAPAAPRLTCHPNPFNPRTTLRFALPADERVRLVLYDAAGRRVRRLAEGFWPAGRHEIPWDGRDDLGRAAAAGVYFARLEAGPWAASASLVLLK